MKKNVLFEQGIMQFLKTSKKIKKYLSQLILII